MIPSTQAWFASGERVGYDPKARAMVATEDFDVRHTFTGYLVYNLPSFSRGAQTSGSRLGIRLAAIVLLRLTIHRYSGLNVSGTFESRDRVDLIGNLYSSSKDHHKSGWHEVRAISEPGRVRPTCSDKMAAENATDINRYRRCRRILRGSLCRSSVSRTRVACDRCCPFGSSTPPRHARL